MIEAISALHHYRPMWQPSIRSVALLGVVLAAPVLGHARLVNSSPTADASVVAPRTLSLSFSEAVKLASLTVTLGDAGVPVTIDRAPVSAKTVTVSVGTLAPGRYEVHWTALSTDDGHVTRGTFAFTVVGAASTT